MAITLSPTASADQLNELSANSIREKILWIAMMEAHPIPGKVTDSIHVYEDRQLVRFGWRRLKQYVDEACNNVSPNFWKQRGMFQGREISYLDGVRLHEHRIPQKNYQTGVWLSGVHWCGIFATWVWRTAGLNVRWMWPNPSGIKPRYEGTLKLGDILVMKGDLIHHCVLVNKQDGPDGWQTVNGNSDHQSILIKLKKPGEIRYFYSVDDLK